MTQVLETPDQTEPIESVQERKLRFLSAANAKRRELKETGELEILDPLEKAYRDPTSLKLAIHAMCFECLGRDHDLNVKNEIGSCAAYACPLWDLRPYQHLAPDGHGAEKRKSALEAVLDDDATLAAAARKPLSRAKAMRAKCFECMGGNRKSIAECGSGFVAAKPPIPTGHLKGKMEYRECPLWPVRPGR
ncbi:MAG: hypothetical protein HYX63_13405 [Gammaproteobacteria bacterium]|nr:hypothetical protein [Gammaproteobacteria bacterium]